MTARAIRRLPQLLACVAVLAVPRPAEAISCSFQSTVGVGFGAYDVFGSTPLDSTGSITFRCVSVQGGDLVTVDLGQGGAGSWSRVMSRGGGDTLAYDLFTNAARTTVWGDGTSGTSHWGPATPPDDTDVTLTIYGRVPALQDASAGSYSDTIVVTINY